MATKTKLTALEKKLLAACKHALNRLLQLDAETQQCDTPDENGTYKDYQDVGSCPACEALRKAIRAAEGR